MLMTQAVMRLRTGTKASQYVLAATAERRKESIRILDQFSPVKLIA